MRVAILIAHAKMEPFETIKRFTHRQIYAEAEQLGFDLFYALGRENNSQIRSHFNRLMERNKHSKFFLFSRIYDYLVLNIYRRYLPRTRVHKDEIQVNIPEDLRHLGVKILCALEYLESQGYEWIYRTTTSSVVNLHQLSLQIRKLSEDTRSDRIIAGTIATRPNSHSFIVGSNLLLSASAVKWILKHRSRWDHSLMDDVALGKVASGYIDFKNLPSMSFSKVEEIRENSAMEMRNAVQIRCKSISNVRDDVKVIFEVLKVINRI